jgi:hypothetical protein
MKLKTNSCQNVLVLFDYARTNQEEYTKVYNAMCAKYEDYLIIPSPAAMFTGVSFAGHVKDPNIGYMYFVCTIERTLKRSLTVVFEQKFPKKKITVLDLDWYR